MEIVKYKYQANNIEFEIDKTIMVNATEMARMFDKKVENFTRTEQTQNFIKTCLKIAKLEEIKTPKSVLFGVDKEEDLIISRQKSGTWMHRALAIKFAAWLDSEFELWIYNTIENLLFGWYRTIIEGYKAIPYLKRQRRLIESKLRENKDYQEYRQINQKLIKVRQSLSAANPDMIELDKISK